MIPPLLETLDLAGIAAGSADLQTAATSPHAAPRRCRNCGHENPGHYCQQCGQKLGLGRITLHDLGHELFHFFTHLDGAPWHTIRQLLTNPGTMQREFLDGKRKRYQKPVSALLISAAFTGLGMFGIRELAHALHGVVDPEGDVIRRFIGPVQLGLLPIFTLITWLTYREAKLNYAEMGVVIIYSLAMLMLLMLPLHLVRLINPGFEMAYLELPVIIGYTTITYLNLEPTHSKVKVIAKSIFVNACCYALIRAVMYFILLHQAPH